MTATEPVGSPGRSGLPWRTNRIKRGMSKVGAVIVAAGRGERAGGGVPKQYRPLAGAPVVRFALEGFARHDAVDVVVPVVHRDDVASFRQAAAGLDLLPPAFGGATRQDSVLAGLEVLATHSPDIVLIHDAARPFVSA